MKYAFTKHLSPDTEALRILAYEAKLALAQLDDFELEPHQRIHKCRQSCKRARALLRLIRPVNSYVFAVENRMYRDVGRRLSILRDQDAMLEAAETLVVAHEHDEAHGSMLFLRELLNESLVQMRSPDDRELQTAVMHCCNELRRAIKRYKNLRISGLDKKCLQQSTEDKIRKVKQAFRKASVTALDDDYHAWRKQTKYAQNQVALTNDYLGCWSAAFATGLSGLATSLGQHQDLTLILSLLNRQRDALAIDNRWNILIADLEAIKEQLRDTVKSQAMETLFGQGVSQTGTSADDIPEPSKISRLRGV